MSSGYDSNTVALAGPLFFENGPVLYYRFVDQSNNVYFHERISLPHTDPDTEIKQRTIIELNNDGRIIAAGRDADLNGTIDNIRAFTYSSEGNLLTATDNNETITISYSNIIDTENYIQNEMIGVRNNSIINSESYSTNPLDGLYTNSGSFNVSTQETTSATYEMNASNFYTKITYPEENNGVYIQTRTIDYVFEN